MLGTIACIGLLVGPRNADEILKCTPDRHGRFKVSESQIEFIHSELRSRDLARVEPLIDPAGVTIRFVYSAVRPPQVSRTHQTKADFLANLKLHLRHDVVVEWSGLLELADEQWSKKRYDTWVYRNAEKGEPAYWFVQPARYMPIWYIKLSCKHHRLWIREFSYGHGEGE